MSFPVVRSLTARVQPVSLFDTPTIGAAGTRTSGTIDCRDLDIISIIAKGTRVSGLFTYKIEWAGLITTADIMGDPTGQPDRIEDYSAHPDLINTSATGNQVPETEARIAVAFSNPILLDPQPILWPFVRFKLTGISGSGSHEVYALLRQGA